MYLSTEEKLRFRTWNYEFVSLISRTSLIYPILASHLPSLPPILHHCVSSSTHDSHLVTMPHVSVLVSYLASLTLIYRSCHQYPIPTIWSGNNEKSRRILGLYRMRTGKIHSCDRTLAEKTSVLRKHVNFLQSVLIIMLTRKTFSPKTKTIININAFRNLFRNCHIRYVLWVMDCSKPS